MSSASMQTKGRKCDEDYIPVLSDCLIEHIFSLLPTRDVVRTCLLSRRWRSYWTTVEDLRFSLSSDHDESFVDRVLTLYGRDKVRKFHLDIRPYCPCNSKVNEWVGFAIDHQVEELLLTPKVEWNIDDEPIYNWFVKVPWMGRTLSPLLYSCSSLTWLVLRGCPFLSCKSISWSLLKSLTIESVSDDMLGKILMGSPVLEYLTLERCRGVKRIHSRSLRELGIYNGGKDNLEILTPRLLSLRATGDWFYTMIRIVEAPSLLAVELDFDSPMKSDFCQLKEMLSELQNATRILLGSWCCRVMLPLKVEDVQVLLPNCKSLTLHVPIPEFSFPAIANMLATAPNLEKLVIIFKPKRLLLVYSLNSTSQDISILDSCSVNHNSYWHIKKKFKRWARHLKNIEIFGFYDCLSNKYEELLVLVKFLLGHASVLENMVIRVMNGSQHLEVVSSNKLLEVARRLKCYCRASEHAAVILNYLEEEHGKRQKKRVGVTTKCTRI